MFQADPPSLPYGSRRAKMPPTALTRVRLTTELPGSGSWTLRRRRVDGVVAEPRPP